MCIWLINTFRETFTLIKLKFYINRKLVTQNANEYIIIHAQFSVIPLAEIQKLISLRPINFYLMEFAFGKN